MDQCSLSWSASRLLSIHPAILCGKNFGIGHCAQPFQPNSFILTMLVGTIEFYHVVPLSLTLAFAGGHKVSTKENL